MWSLEFERWTGWIRNVRLGEFEVIRAIYAGVRGENWETFRSRVTTSHQCQQDDQFEATWTVEIEEPAYRFEGRVAGNPDSLEIAIRGESSSEFLTRRTGMCVLHPMELAGLSCEAGLFDGSKIQRAFPIDVEPHQPFFDIRTLSYPTGTASVSLEFSGEVFEMEDQRNWTDASFKTYCRPQALPQPYSIAIGETLTHRLKVTRAGSVPMNASVPKRLSISEEVVSIPRLGTVADEVREEWDFVLDAHADNPWESAGLGNLAFGVKFVDINRNRPLMTEWDGVAFGASPQVHTTDDRSIIENTHTLREVCHSAKVLAEGKICAVGPLRLRSSRQISDDRIEMPIGQVWCLASIIHAAIGGADAIAVEDAHACLGPLRTTLEILRRSCEGTFRPYHSSHPYEFIGIRLDADRDVFINLTPYLQIVEIAGAEVELEPFAILEIG
ncbi:MAG: hypothetical protein IT203_01140 [Fimbriimonadaceae bacterium]|nr:hypothetical protein [Fimbriimonadaceae bacterium]